MPCFKRENSLSLTRQRKKANERDPLAPHPVRPRAIKYHGLFSIPIASQHMIVDEKWAPSSLCDQFAGMSDLLRRRVIYKRHETRTQRHRLQFESRRLKTQCADGHRKLQKITSGHNAHTIRNYLSHHRDMQRLYQKMPIHLVADNINQRTFVMRKERDRLEFRLGQLKQRYKQLLVERGKVENLVKYEFVLEEELQSRVLLKKIQNSNVRMRAIRTINTTYKKMLQVLLHDQIFYEPILHSLDGDMEEQSNFIKNILYLGMPAISKFKVLNHEFRSLEEKSRQNLQAKMQILAELKSKKTVEGPPQIKTREITNADPSHYVRATENMIILKIQLQSIENTIKELKLITLCAQAKEIYPNVKSQVEANQKLHRKIEHSRQNREMLNDKMKYATLLEGVLINNLSEEEINRLEYMSDLKASLKSEETYEKETQEFITNRSNAYVLLRMSLWNFIEILRHVDNNCKTFVVPYPNSYLRLPLLKFEILPMHAAPPEWYEEDVPKIMDVLKRKVYKLIRRFSPEMIDDLINSKEKYHAKYLASISQSELCDDEGHQVAGVGEDLLQEQKTMAHIPSRKQIKALSARVLEEVAKRD